MSVVTYASIRMDLVRTIQVLSRPIRSTDGTTYLCTEWSHEFIALLNPENLSYTTDGIGLRGQMPADTIQGIRQRLSQPRRDYSWEVGGRTVISSPANGDTTDMRNGPIVDEALSIVQVVGSRSFIVRMKITTWLNECDDAPVILSHRWQPTLEVDEHRYSTRTIVGEIEFNIPKLIELSRGPDNYRLVISGHQVPNGFQRVGLQTAASSDGATVHYEVIDRERPIDIGRNCPAVDIDVQMTAGHTGTGAAGIALGAAEGAGAVLGGFYRDRLASQAFSRRGARRVYNRGAFATMAALGAVSGAWSALARQYVNVTVSCAGDRNAECGSLLRIAAEIAEQRVGAVGFGDGALNEYQAQLNYTQKTVTYSVTHSASAAVVLANSGADALADVANWTARESTNLFNWLTGNPGRLHAPPGSTPQEVLMKRLTRIPNSFGYLTGVISDAGNIGNPTFYRDGTAGTYTEKLVVAALLTPCEGPTLAGTIQKYQTSNNRDFEQ